MIKAIIFDCFGVVLGDALGALSRELLAENPDTVSQVWDLVNQSNRGLLTSDQSSRRIAKLFDLSYEDYRGRLNRAEVKDQALLAYITTLRTSYKTAMLSNVSAGSLERRFTAAELDGHFEVVIASGDIGFAKPEARAYEITAERLGVRLDECIFTDDREPYCEGARAVGMQAILYQSFAQFKSDLEALLR